MRTLPRGLAAALLAGLGCLALASPPSAETADPFELTYKGSSGSKAIRVYEPPFEGAKPLVILVPGTGAALDHPRNLAYATALSARGFVVAIVDYPRFFGLTSCSRLGAKAADIFGRSSEHSALNVIYRGSSADPLLGLAVIGSSQGAWIAHLAPLFTEDVEVRAALLLATGTEIRMNSPFLRLRLPCNSQRAAPVKQVLAVTGDSDGVYSAPGTSRREQLRHQLAEVTGRVCQEGWDCRDPATGSGWILVPSSAVSDGNADHEFSNRGRQPVLDPVWLRSDAPWGLSATLDWLESGMER
jgi:hypothetical protein